MLPDFALILKYRIPIVAARAKNIYDIYTNQQDALSVCIYSTIFVNSTCFERRVGTSTNPETEQLDKFARFVQTCRIQ
jgi:hypothetical protein